MTINGIFFDLYGTLLVYGNMDTAWSDWLKTLYVQLKLRGFTRSIDSLAKSCDQFYSKSEPTPRQHDLTVFEQRKYWGIAYLGEIETLGNPLDLEEVSEARLFSHFPENPTHPGPFENQSKALYHAALRKLLDTKD